MEEMMAAKTFTHTDGTTLIVAPGVGYTFRWGEHILTLNRSEFEVLACLHRYSPYVVQRPKLTEEALKTSHCPESNLAAVHISHIRKKIAAIAPGTEWFLQTVRGRGVKLSDAPIEKPSRWNPVYVQQLFRKLKQGALTPKDISDLFPDMSYGELVMWQGQYLRLGNVGLMLRSIEGSRRKRRRA